MDYVPEPTLKHKQPFTAERESFNLYSAMAGKGHDEEQIIDILTSCSNVQRQEIKKAYERAYNEQLKSVLLGNLGSSFRYLINALMDSPYNYLATALDRCICMDGLENTIFIEIFCTRTNDDRKKIIFAYSNLHNRELLNDLRGIPQIYFRRLMEIMITTDRESDISLTDLKARKVAKKLYDSGRLRLGIDCDIFNNILAQYSFPQLRIIFKEYEQLKKMTIEEAIVAEMEEDLQTAYKAMIECILNPLSFIANRIYWVLTGIADDRTLMRLIVCRAEMDLENIKEEFHKMFHVNLVTLIEVS